MNDSLNLAKTSERVLGRYLKLGYDKLSSPEKLFVCIWELEAEVNNGGFHQYYFNSSGDQSLDALESLRTIGAQHTAGLVEAANRIFGPDGPPRDWVKRQERLLSLPEAVTSRLSELDEQFYKYDDNLEALLTAYVSKNASAFEPV